MSEQFNVYCDESCHLENDQQSSMVLGAVWLPKHKRRDISTRLTEIKARHGLNRSFEIKWTKVSDSKVQFYLDCIDYFFDDDDLHFRGLVADKSMLNHGEFEQSHDDWYYKMYFVMLKNIFDPEQCYNLYLDIKDTLGARKVDKLHDVLANNMYDFSRQIILKVQQVHSHESDILQLSDLLIGALAYQHRGLDSSSAKLRLVKRIQERSGYKLTHNTLMRELKFNLLIWRGRD